MLWAGGPSLSTPQALISSLNSIIPRSQPPSVPRVLAIVPSLVSECRGVTGPQAIPEQGEDRRLVSGPPDVHPVRRPDDLGQAGLETP